MRSVRELNDIAGKRVLVRVDFNLPIENGIVLDDYRIKKTFPTIEFLRESGAKVILLSHLGKGGVSLEGVCRALNKYTKAKFNNLNLGNGEVTLLENLRNDPREQSSDPSYAEELAQLGDAYVNEAFPVSHREDASIVLLPKLLPAYAGFQLEAEVRSLSQTFQSPERPFLFILGGAKFSTKIPLIEKYLELADYVFLGGALANNFLKAKGYEVGGSLLDDATHDFKKMLANPKLIIPSDTVVQSGNKLIEKKVEEVKPEDTIVDIGAETVQSLEPYIKNAKLVLWNGPLGKYEAGGEKGTKKVLKLVAESRAKVIIGGGDLVSVFSSLEPKSYNLKPNFFVSTGGGATLEFLASGTLPGIEALN